MGKLLTQLYKYEHVCSWSPFKPMVGCLACFPQRIIDPEEVESAVTKKWQSIIDSYVQSEIEYVWIRPRWFRPVPLSKLTAIDDKEQEQMMLTIKQRREYLREWFKLNPHFDCGR